MMNKLGLIIVSVILALIQTGCAEQSTWMSLNSSNPRIIWEVKPLSLIHISEPTRPY